MAQLNKRTLGMRTVRDNFLQSCIRCENSHVVMGSSAKHILCILHPEMLNAVDFVFLNLPFESLKPALWDLSFHSSSLSIYGSVDSSGRSICLPFFFNMWSFNVTVTVYVAILLWLISMKQATTT